MVFDYKRHDTHAKRHIKPVKRSGSKRSPDVHHPCLDLVKDATQNYADTIISNANTALDNAHEQVHQQLEALRSDDKQQYLASRAAMQTSLRRPGETQVTLKIKGNTGDAIEKTQSLDKTMHDFQSAVDKKIEALERLFAHRREIRSRIGMLRSEMLADDTGIDEANEVNAVMKREVAQVVNQLQGDAEKLARDEKQRGRDRLRLQEELLRMTAL